MKTCSKCEIEKPLDEFYTHPRTADGYSAACKECTKVSVRANRKEKIDYYKAYDRSRAWRPDRVKARQEHAARRRDDPELKRIDKEQKSRWKDRNFVKRRAHIMTGNAIKYGYIIRPSSCERCGKHVNVNAHHEDYYRPLEVVWLCTTCHGLRHREINELLRNGADLRCRGFDPLPLQDAAE